MFLLDTDTSIFLLNRKDPAVELKLKGLAREEIAVSTLTMAELLFGAVHSKKREANQKRVEIFCASLTLCPFDAAAAEIFGYTKEYLLARGEIIGIMDLLIASVALARKAVLVSHNQQEFRRIPNLKLEDWFGT
jgi:tRNA(fMet)-specific endonuclease VapC